MLQSKSLARIAVVPSLPCSMACSGSDAGQAQLDGSGSGAGSSAGGVSGSSGASGMPGSGLAGYSPGGAGGSAQNGATGGTGSGGVAAGGANGGSGNGAAGATTGGAGGGPTGPDKTPKQRVLDFLSSISGQRTVSGIHNRYSEKPGQYTAQIHEVTAQYPGFWSGDFLFDPSNIAARGAMIEQAKLEWSHGALVNIMYHACPPTQNEACEWEGGVLSHLSDDQWQDLVTDQGELNRIWKARLDEIVPFLQTLKDAGVAPLFRPHHEMNQGAFWWGGRKGQGGTSQLFRITHDYLAKEKGLDNLIWVWDVQDLDADWAPYDPGSDYFDLAALDVYGDGFKSWKYDLMKQVAGGKPIAIGECARLPTAAELMSQPDWTFFMSWSELTFSDNSSQEIQDLYASPRILKLADMPGW